MQETSMDRDAQIRLWCGNETAMGCVGGDIMLGESEPARY